MDVCEAMETALGMEEQARQSYAEAAEKATNPLAKRTFEALAEWETEHKRLLESVRAQAEATKACPLLSELNPQSLEIMRAAEEIFKGALDDLKGELASDASLDDAYAAAMAKERKAIEFYRRRLEETIDANEQDLYEFLLNQEREHLNLLATTEEYLNDTQYWHFKQEMWIVTG